MAEAWSWASARRERKQLSRAATSRSGGDAMAEAWSWELGCPEPGETNKTLVPAQQQMRVLEFLGRDFLW